MTTLPLSETEPTKSADAAIMAAIPHASDKVLAALRSHVVHREQLRRLGVVPKGKPGTDDTVKGAA